MEVVDFFRKPEKFRASGARPPKGVLLVGPPGEHTGPGDLRGRGAGGRRKGGCRRGCGSACAGWCGGHGYMLAVCGSCPLNTGLLPCSLLVNAPAMWDWLLRLLLTGTNSGSLFRAKTADRPFLGDALLTCMTASCTVP